MYKIHLADDSALMRKIICDIINKDPEFEVVVTSSNGQEAFENIKSNEADLTVLDMILPRLSGLEIMAKVSQENIPAKVILISSSLKEDTESTVKAMGYGALGFVVKPYAATPDSRVAFANELLDIMRRILSSKSYDKVEPAHTVRETHDIHRSIVSERNRDNIFQRGIKAPCDPPPAIKGKKLIALACSTGGPQSLHKFIPMLPATLRYPMVLVQHMPAGFTASLAERLDEISKVHVVEATEGEFLEPGCVYIAPGGKHLQILESKNHEAYCHIDDGPAVNSLKPCADVMYQSIASTSFEEIICVVLTGMGMDGTDGIEYLKKYRNIYTISQDEATCVVYGMPKAVAQKGLSDEVRPLLEVADAIMKRITN